MDGKLSATTTTLRSFSRSLSAAAQIHRSHLPLLRSRRITTTGNSALPRSSTTFNSDSPSQFHIAGAAVSPVRCHLQCVPTSSASFASSGSGGTGGGGVDDVSPLSSDVIVLHVRGMMCGGCESSVKRILENQSQVSSASADHTTETAIVWPVSEAKVTPNWQKVIGEELAKNLTNCGFESNLRV